MILYCMQKDQCDTNNDRVTMSPTRSICGLSESKEIMWTIKCATFARFFHFTGFLSIVYVKFDNSDETIIKRILVANSCINIAQRLNKCHMSIK